MRSDCHSISGAWFLLLHNYTVTPEKARQWNILSFSNDLKIGLSLRCARAGVRAVMAGEMYACSIRANPSFSAVLASCWKDASQQGQSFQAFRGASLG